MSSHLLNNTNRDSRWVHTNPTIIGIIRVLYDNMTYLLKKSLREMTWDSSFDQCPKSLNSLLLQYLLHFLKHLLR